MKIGIILISHGDFAQAALRSVFMIAGEQQHIQALSLREDMSLEVLERELEKAYNALRIENDYILILCDIYGGSPCNAVIRLMLKGNALIAYTGLSLPLLIDVIFSREQISSLDELRTHIQETQNMIVKEIEMPSLDEDDEEDM